MNAATRMLPVLLALLAGACTQPPDAPPVARDPAPQSVVARGRVDIEGGSLALAMPVDGVVSEVRVKEGQRVERGQVLLATDATPALLDEQLASARLAQAKAQVALLERKLAAAKVRAGRLVAAAREGAGDWQSADDARDAVAQGGAEWVAARAGVALARANLQRAGYQVKRHVLRAPLQGDVLRLTAWPGLRVSPQGATLVTLLPATARIVRAELSQDSIERVAVGARAVVLSDDGRQTVLGNAHVLRIGPTYGQSLLQEDPLQRVNERSVDCVLAFEPTSMVRVGQRVLVRFAALHSGRAAAVQADSSPVGRQAAR